MTTNNPNDEAWTDSAPQEQDSQQGREDSSVSTPEEGDSADRTASGPSFKVVSAPEGGSAGVTREEIEQQTAEMAARTDESSHIDYAAALDNAPGAAVEESNDEEVAAVDAASPANGHDEQLADGHDEQHVTKDRDAIEDRDVTEDQHENGGTITQHGDHSQSEQSQDEAGGKHSLGAVSGGEEVQGDHSLGADSGVEADPSDHSLGGRTGEGRDRGDRDQGDHSLDDQEGDSEHEGGSALGLLSGDEDQGDHSLGAHAVDDDRKDHSLGGHGDRHEDASAETASSTSLGSPSSPSRDDSAPPLYRDAERASGSEAGDRSGADSDNENAGSNAGSDSATSVAPAVAAAPAVVPVPPPAPDRAQQRADRDHALGKREKQQGAEEQAPAKPKPTTDKFFGSLGLFLLRVALAGVMGIYGLQKVMNIEGVQALLTSTALRDIVPENFMMLLAWTLAIGELVIAAGLLFGFLTRVAGVGAVLGGVGALVLVKWLTNPIQFEGGALGFAGSLELMIAAAGLLFLFLGAGRWSLDGALRSRRAAKKAHR